MMVQFSDRVYPDWLLTSRLCIYWKYVVVAEHSKLYMLKFKCSYLHYFSNILDVSSKNNRPVYYLKRLYGYIYWKFVHFYEHEQENEVSILAIFHIFSHKSSEIHLKLW